MKPDAWLAASSLAKTRRKLPDWGRGHLIAYAQQLFGTDDLSKEQLKELVTRLSSGGVPRPDPSEASVTGAKVMREVKLSPNPGSLGNRTEHYVSGAYAGLRFANPADLTGWALKLLWEAKEPWHKVKHSWRQSQKLTIFTPLEGVSVAPDLQTLLARRQRQTDRETMALPTRPTIRQAFWGFNVGDRLHASLKALLVAHKPQNPVSTRGKKLTPFAPVSKLFHPRRDLVLEVTHVRPNPETAPTVTLQELP